MGNQGDLRGEREIGEATHADFFRAVHPFLVYFVLFSPISFFVVVFLKNKKLPQELYVRVFCPMMDIKLFFIIGI